MNRPAVGHQYLDLDFQMSAKGYPFRSLKSMYNPPVKYNVNKSYIRSVEGLFGDKIFKTSLDKFL